MTASGPADAVMLRATLREDVPLLFVIQSDPLSNEMAGTRARTREAFFAVWEGIFANPLCRSMTVECGGVVVGGVSCFQAGGEDHVGYWVAREHWGRGIATKALSSFLLVEPRRPLHATTAWANAGSKRVLERNGFRLVGRRMGEETER
ncbi:MAG: GNAT family N-acetyltransferase [Phycisphaerales bacterium]